MRQIKRAMAALLAAALIAAPISVVADPWKNEAGPGRGGPPAAAGKHAGRGGPPPWAPAHGYRAKQRERHHHHDRHEGYATGFPRPPLDLEHGRCNREMIGRVLGGAAGAAIGSQIGDGSGRIVAIIGGTILGVFLGGEIGRRMDEADQLCVDQTFEHAPDGRTIAWSNPDAGEQYRVTPQHTYRTEAGTYCREYTARSTVGGETVETYGTACRQPDGSWRIMN